MLRWTLVSTKSSAYLFGVRIREDLYPGVKGFTYVSFQCVLTCDKCEHFKLTKGDPNKMVLCLKDYRLDKVCTVSLRQLVMKD